MTPTPHPFLKLPTQEQARALMARGEEGVAQLRKVLEDREALIRKERDDAFRYGVRLENWKRAKGLMEEVAEVYLLGGNRASKSECCAWMAMEVLVNGPWWKTGFEKQRALADGVQVACFHSTERSSIRQQQKLMYHWMPQEWRKVGKVGSRISVRYNQTSGFTNMEFILPNFSTCHFYNYKQDLDVFEGYEYDFIWCDELVPLEMLETLRYRTATRDGRLAVGFTPTHGYTPTVKAAVTGTMPVETRVVDVDVFGDGDGARILEARLAKGCPKGHVPVVAMPHPRERAVMWFHSDGNPFNPYQNIISRCQGRSRGERLIRAYGYTERSEAGAFPKFARKAHVITRARFEELRTKPGTVYVCGDPGGAKPWFVKWYWVTREGWIILYREWPDYPTYGWWAAASDRVDWKPGPAQKAAYTGGIVAVKQMILEAEGWEWRPEDGGWVPGAGVEEPLVRFIDPRMGGMTAPSDEHETSLIMLMEDEQRDANGVLIGPSMEWIPARAGGSKSGRGPVAVSIELMNEYFDWNEDEPVSPVNHPRWFVVEDCEQSILAYQEFTGQGTDRDALKDIIDPDRYLVNSDPDYVEPGMMQVVPGGSY